MPQSGPISKQNPDFNILGLLLGGRGYAANYFNQNDANQRQQIQQDQRGQFAQGLLQTPQFAAAVTDPGLKAQYGLWAQQMGGQDANAAIGNSILDKAVGNYYGKDAAKFDDTLARGRIQMTSDVALKADQIRRDRDIAQQKTMMDYVTGPGAASQIMKNAAAKQAGIDVPSGYDVVPAGGGYGFRPTAGSPAWGSMVGEIGALNNINGGYGDLLNMAKNGTGSQGAWEATRANMINDMRKAFETGTLDEGSLNFFQKLVPERWDDFKANPTQWGIVQEKLATGQKLMQGRLQAVGDKYLVDPSTLPNRYSGSFPTPGKDIPNPPSESPLSAQRGLQRQRDGAKAARDKAVTGGVVPLDRSTVWSNRDAQLPKQQGGGGW